VLIPTGVEHASCGTAVATMEIITTLISGGSPGCSFLPAVVEGNMFIALIANRNKAS